MKDAWNVVGGKVYVAPVGADPKDPSRWHQLGTLTEIATERQTERWHHRSEVIETISGTPEYTLTTQGPVTLFKPEPVKTRPSVEFTFNTMPFSLDALALYYGTDVKAVGIVNNRGEARKEEKHMGVRKFESSHGDAKLRVDSDRVGRTAGSTGAYVKMFGGEADAYGWFEKADVPLIAHALFEKSGWPDAKKDSMGDWEVKLPNGDSTWGFKIGSDEDASEKLAGAIAILAAYNAWHEGKAAREAAEAAKKAEAEAAAAKKREHDELRTSPIALEALEIYNKFNGTSYKSWASTMDGRGVGDEKVRTFIGRVEAARAKKERERIELRTSPIALEALSLYNDMGGTSYSSWDLTVHGEGRTDATVNYWIRQAEAARAAKPAPKVGDRVRVSAEGARRSGACFGGEVEGVVVSELDGDGDIKIKASTANYPLGICQYIEAKYVTVLAAAEEVAAEKAKAERGAGIAALAKALGTTPDGPIATKGYDAGIRATA